MDRRFEVSTHRLVPLIHHQQASAKVASWSAKVTDQTHRDTSSSQARVASSESQHHHNLKSIRTYRSWPGGYKNEYATFTSSTTRQFQTFLDTLGCRTYLEIHSELAKRLCERDIRRSVAWWRLQFNPSTPHQTTIRRVNNRGIPFPTGHRTRTGRHEGNVQRPHAT